MAMGKERVQAGDRFVKVDDQRIVWVVERVMEVAHSVTHAHLIQEADPTRRITLSEPVLLDPRYHRRLDPE